MFPVYAGVILSKNNNQRNPGCVPRVCGGDPLPSHHLGVPLLVFPVYAGVIPEDRRSLVAVICVPRVCGGDPKRSVLK